MRFCKLVSQIKKQILFIFLIGYSSLSGAEIQQNQPLNHKLGPFPQRPNNILINLKPLLKNPSIIDSNFVNQEGKTISVKNLLGKVLVVNFIFTHCKTICPIQTDALRRVQTDLKQQENYNDLVFLSISIDPESDTPNTLKTFSEHFHIDASNWHFVTAEKPVIDNFIKNFKVNKKRIGKNNFDHRTSVSLIDQQGNLVQMYSGSPVDTDRLTSEVAASLKREILNKH